MDIQRARVLIVDDEESQIYTLTNVFNDHIVKAFSRPADALESLKAGEIYDVLLVDFRMQGMSGLELLCHAKKLIPSYRAVLITAYSNRELLEKGINNNLFHRVVNKPFDPESLHSIVQEEIELLWKARSDREYCTLLEERIASLTNSAGQGPSLLVYASTKIQDLFATTRKYAKSGASVLIEGESGTGKELIANLLHSESRRSKNPIIKVNCAAIPDHLFESELFGYKKGAFTGASFDKPGKFQLANGGTLFLDEVGELPIHQQTKLLRAIEDQEISPLGSTTVEKVDVRIVCATNKNLEDMERRGTFRGDLRYRLNTLNIQVPPLRSRREDIPILATYFLSEIANREGQITKRLAREAVEYLSLLQLPGNVRELKNLVHRAYILSEDSVIDRTDIEYHREILPRNGGVLVDLSLTLGDLEREYIRVQLEKHEYSVDDTAEVLGIKPCNFSRKLKNMGISVKELIERAPLKAA